MKREKLRNFSEPHLLQKMLPFFIFVQCFKEALVAGPKNDDNYFEWDANILGPEDTCFEYG